MIDTLKFFLDVDSTQIMVAVLTVGRSSESEKKLRERGAPFGKGG